MHQNTMKQYEGEFPNTMKQYEGVTLVKKYTLALKKIAKHEEKLAEYEGKLAEHKAKLALHRAVAEEAMQNLETAMQNLEKLEKDAKNPKKRARDEDTLPTPPPEKKKIRDTPMTSEEAQAFVDNRSLVHETSSRKLNTVVGVLSDRKITWKVANTWTKEQKIVYINTRVVPEVVPEVHDSSDDEDSIASFEDRISKLMDF